MIVSRKPAYMECLQWQGANIDEILEFNSKVIYEDGNLILPTSEGEKKVPVGSFIMKNEDFEFYICSPELFHKEYVVVED